jgi:isopenicillin N synthase-like dioxygenase
MDTLSVSVDQLIAMGHAFVEVDNVLLKNAKTAWKQVVPELGLWPEGFPITRRGEREPDLGLIFRPGKGEGDYKYFLHTAHDLCLYMSQFQKKLFSEYEQQFLALDALRRHLDDVALQLTRQLDTRYGQYFCKPLSPSVQMCAKNSKPYATTTLRSLWYPAAETQEGAMLHIDRDVLTIHVGDEGGSLIACDNQNGDNQHTLSPPESHAVVFFGVKVLYLSDGKIQPLWHGSTVEEGNDRLAMVQFVQADVGFEVENAKQVYRDFYESQIT